MQKNIGLALIAIIMSSHLNAMKPETKSCWFTGMPTDVMNLIASFLTFDDIESEEEFINRKKGPSSYPKTFYSKTKKITIEEEEDIIFDSSDDLELKQIVLTEKEVENSQEEICPEEPTRERFDKDRVKPRAWLEKHKDIKDHVYLIVYSANRNICGITYRSQNTLKADTLSIVNTITDEEVNNVTIYNETHREKYFNNLAISSNGNIYAKIYVKKIDKIIGFQSRIKIKNLQTQKTEYPVCPSFPKFCSTPTIAFNKQDTHLIIYKVGRDPNLNKDVLHHAIIPLTTTLEQRDDQKIQEKTLQHYFQQKMICKNFQQPT